jgi:hypothetical protein
VPGDLFWALVLLALISGMNSDACTSCCVSGRLPRSVHSFYTQVQVHCSVANPQPSHIPASQPPMASLYRDAPK